MIMVKKVILFLSVFLCSFLSTQAQDKLEFGDTGMTNKSPKYKSNKKDFKQKKSIEIITRSSRGLLLGNSCVEEYMASKRYRYLLVPLGEGSSMSGFKVFTHNFGAKFILFFRNGPFWKINLIKKRKKCRSLTGDFVG